MYITHLFNEIFTSEDIPEDWLISDIILIHKKIDKAAIENYRPISKSSHLYKLFTKVIQNRIKDKLEEGQPVNQVAFRRNYSTTEHLFVMNQLIEKAQEYNIPVYVAFLDYPKTIQ